MPARWRWLIWCHGSTQVASSCSTPSSSPTISNRWAALKSRAKTMRNAWPRHCWCRVIGTPSTAASYAQPATGRLPSSKPKRPRQIGRSLGFLNRYNLVVVAWNTLGLGDALVLFGGLEDGAVAQLANDTALDFLPWRLVLGVFVAASRLQIRPARGNLFIGDQDIGLPLVEIDPHLIAGSQNGQIAARRRFWRSIEDRG